MHHECRPASSEGHPSFRDPSQRNKWIVFKTTGCDIRNRNQLSGLLPDGQDALAAVRPPALRMLRQSVDHLRRTCRHGAHALSVLPVVLVGVSVPYSLNCGLFASCFPPPNYGSIAKLALLHSICQIIVLNNDVSQIMQLVDLLILLSDPPDSGTLERLRPLLGIKPITLISCLRGSAPVRASIVRLNDVC